MAARFTRVGALIILVAACNGDAMHTAPKDDGSNPFNLTTTGPGVLSVTPLDTSTLYASSPLGAMAPPGHVLPTDHVYMYFVDGWNGRQQANDCSPKAVRAAGRGVVDFILAAESNGDMKVDVQMTKTFHYYYDHVVLKPGIVRGSRVSAGDTIATTNGRCPSMDLGTWDSDVVPSGLVNPSRYSGQTLHAVSPYRYFSEPLRSWLYSRVHMYEGVPSNKDGRTDWGVRGTLAGDWFHESMANDSASVINGPSGWPRSLVFAYDWYDNTQVRISIGGTIAASGLLRVAPADPDPARVTAASGMVTYRGTPTLGLISSGWVVVQMLSDLRLRVEFVPGDGPRPTSFSTAAQEYVR